MQSNDSKKFQPINGQPSGLKLVKKTKLQKIIFRVSVVLVVLGAVFAVVFMLWIKIQLLPIDKNAVNSINLTIEDGTTSFDIAQKLEKNSIIRSSTAFKLYIRYLGVNNRLQAGQYRFSPSESAKQVVGRLVKGDVEKITVTFFPGATLRDNHTEDESKKYDVKTIMQRAGFSETEIERALGKTYDSPVFQDKPGDADLEGYIYGETYSFKSGTSAENVIQSAIDELYSVVQENGLIDAFSKQGLNLYEGVTLASIVQREANTTEDQRQVAQVFHLRLKTGMSLGSDVTYQYIADKLGVERDVNLDSPYNTRRFEGLPPGPIATPGLSALLAVANPAEGDFLYFLAGDDGTVYYAKTQSEHDSNIIQHCQIGCSTL